MSIIRSISRIIPRTAYNLYIDVSHCKLKCPMCPRGGVNSLENPDKGLMEFDLFKKIVDKFAEEKVRIDGITFGNWGEPLLNPDLPKMIRYAKSHPTAMKHKTSVAINTTLNNLPNPLKLLQSGVKSIIISTSGMKQETYSKNHKGGNVEKVLENIKELVRVRKQEILDKVKLRMAFHGYIYNSEDAELAKEFCEEQGIRFTHHRPSIISVGNVVCFDKDKKKQSKFYRQYIDIDKETAGMKTLDYDKINDCHLRKKRVTVNFDGQLYRCCEVYEKKHFMGSIFDFRIKEIPDINSNVCRLCADTPASWHN